MRTFFFSLPLHQALPFFVPSSSSCLSSYLLSAFSHHGQPAAGSLPLAAHLFVFRRNVNDSDSGCGVWRWNLLKRDRAVTDCESAQKPPVSVGVSGWHHSPPGVHGGGEMRAPGWVAVWDPWHILFFVFRLQTSCADAPLLLFQLLSLNIKWEANWGSSSLQFCQLLSFYSFTTQNRSSSPAF